MILIKSLTKGPVDTNGYLVFDEKTLDGIVIDVPMGSYETFLKMIKQYDIKIWGIYLTHAHFDHVADAHKLQKVLSVPVYIHAGDKEYLSNPGSDGLGDFGIEPVLNAEEIKDKDTIEKGTLIFEVMHTPGHSPGSVSLYFEKEKVLFSGDTMFKNSYGRVDFPTSEPEKMTQSLKRLIRLPGDVIVYSGHGPKTTINEEKEMNY